MDDIRELLREAESGDSVSQTHLAAILAKSGNQKDVSGALYWYLEAVGSGFVDAMWNAGTMLINGEGGISDRDFGLYLIKIAAENRNTSACLFLANCYENGFEGLERNLDLANQWNKNAGDIDNQKDFAELIDVDSYLTTRPNKPTA